MLTATEEALARIARQVEARSVMMIAVFLLAWFF